MRLEQSRKKEKKKMDRDCLTNDALHVFIWCEGNIIFNLLAKNEEKCNLSFENYKNTEFHYKLFVKKILKRRFS